MEGDDAFRRYQRWLKYQRAHREFETELKHRLKFSFVVPVYNTLDEQLRECFDSILNQTYPNFELIIVDDHSSWESVRPILKAYESDDRVKVIYRTENGHISKATNDGIEQVTGDFIAFMDCDDTIEFDTLYHFAKALNENPELDFIYSDEDKLTEDGKVRHMPFFKPDWSPDLYLCENYTNHLSVFRASIVKELGGLRSEYNGSQDYDFTLRFLKKTTNQKVGHIPKMLYHWRERKESAASDVAAKGYALYTNRAAKADHIRRNHLAADMEYIPDCYQYRVVFHPQGDPKVSIIIPSKDYVDVLKRCIESVQDVTTYKNYEIIVVDNGSSEEIWPARIDEALAGKIKDVTCKIFTHLGCSGVVRADYILGEDGLYFLEVNTIPGMTNASLVPKMIRAAGMDITSFLSTIIENS